MACGRVRMSVEFVEQDAHVRLRAGEFHHRIATQRKAYGADTPFLNTWTELRMFQDAVEHFAEVCCPLPPQSEPFSSVRFGRIVAGVVHSGGDEPFPRQRG